VEERAPDALDESFEIAFGVPGWDGGAHVRRLLALAGTREHTLQSFTEAPPLNPEMADQLISRWYEWRSRMLNFFTDFDVIVCPVNARVALPHGFMADPDVLAAFSYTAAYNATGWPGVVVRAGTSPEGLPIGVQVVTTPGREDVALAVARLIESGLGGYQRPAI
jgi:amidase